MSTTLSQPYNQRARTKIVATVGPACFEPDQLGELAMAGVDIFRLNMAHGNLDQHQKILAMIRATSEKQSRPIGVLVDLSGPKIRLGQLDTDPLDCPHGAEFEFVQGTPESPHQLTSNYRQLVDELKVGDRVLLADGTVGMEVIESSGSSVRCRVTIAGILRSRQGINLPGVKLSVASITEKDRENAAWAAANGADFVSLSFVRSPDEIHELREILRSHGSHAMVIAKIEKPEALQRLEDIVMASDGIMVARGDLGVEIDVAETPIAQKRIIDTCTRFRRPVIVATQMLDSMQHLPRPTRAEASDVANAILDGADACMLSGETAVGKYPTASVATMNRIMLATERLLLDQPVRQFEPDPELSGVHPVTEAVVYGAARIANRLNAKLMAITTRSGRTALTKSKQRDVIVAVGISKNEQTLRKMTLYWGIEPLYGAPQNGDTLESFIDEWGKANNILDVGDLVVIMASGEFHAGAHNRVVVHEVA